jgi:hypothetical protein
VIFLYKKNDVRRSNFSIVEETYGCRYVKAKKRESMRPSGYVIFQLTLLYHGLTNILCMSCQQLLSRDNISTFYSRTT